MVGMVRRYHLLQPNVDHLPIEGVKRRCLAYLLYKPFLLSPLHGMEGTIYCILQPIVGPTCPFSHWYGVYEVPFIYLQLHVDPLPPHRKWSEVPFIYYKSIADPTLNCRQNDKKSSLFAA
ncbi:hypothetical protein AVEN_140129-1 [Araneus ventricosus]|uniref:Uncharacterized protein n=1 Tax=Araneus ventricosus TaxID=182803 RepID=A0A4Y2S889_ARAVE|nr:hypothetical protein AVEN_140129-1 [Araneus ventricosus]